MLRRGVRPLALWRTRAPLLRTRAATAALAFSSCLQSSPPLARVCRRALHSSAHHCAPHDVAPALARDLRQLIEHDRVVLFLTGTPAEPRCRFTSMLVDVMEQLGVRYSYYDILDDDEVCEGLKQYSDWPTYPQVYVDGELLGGYDVCREMMLSGALTRLLKDKALV